MSYDRQDKEEARIYLLKNKTEKITPPSHAWQDSFPKKEAQNQTKIIKKKKQQTTNTTNTSSIPDLPISEIFACPQI